MAVGEGAARLGRWRRWSGFPQSTEQLLHSGCCAAALPPREESGSLTTKQRVESACASGLDLEADSSPVCQHR